MSVHQHTAFDHPSRDESPHAEAEHLTAQLTLAVARSRALGRPSHALLTVELDGFAGVHATFGAAAAERLLAAVGHRLRASLGGDDEIARVGREEFNVLMDCGGNAAEAWRAAELALHQFARPFPLEDRVVAITACIGVALVQPHHTSAADVMRDAFEAVHRAKLTGTARCVLFDDQMHGASIGQLRLAAELRHALDRNEFAMRYQPILDCASGRVSSMEALVRWEHPVRGELLPCEFLDAVHQAGLVAPLGQWIIEEVCRQAVAWRDDAGVTVPIAINLSPRQLAEPGFVPRLLETIRESRACPDSLSFEVTEDIELGKGEVALRALRAIRGAGFEIRVDDFGTGYSSLSYLQRLPIDGLKIDRAFVHHLQHDSRRREIVAAIIGLAHVLDLDVVAEGIEQQEQLDILRTLGCDRAQGFLLCHPLPAGDALTWLRRQP